MMSFSISARLVKWREEGGSFKMAGRISLAVERFSEPADRLIMFFLTEFVWPSSAVPIEIHN